MINSEDKKLEKEWLQSQKKLSDRELVKILGRKETKRVAIEEIYKALPVYKKILEEIKRLYKTSKKRKKSKDFTSEFFKIWAETVVKMDLQPLRKKIRGWKNLYILTAKKTNKSSNKNSHLFNKNIVDEIKNNIQLKDIVEEYTKLVPIGENFYGRCPFPDHEDKHPSFYIYTKNQRYHCYGCGRHGDVINFVMEIENFDFKTALKKLKKYY